MKTDYSYLKDLDMPPEEEIVLKPVKWPLYILLLASSVFNILIILWVNQVLETGLSYFTPTKIIQFGFGIPLLIYSFFLFLYWSFPNRGEIIVSKKGVKCYTGLFPSKNEFHSWEDISKIYCMYNLLGVSPLKMKLNSNKTKLFTIVEYPGLPTEMLAETFNKWLTKV